MDKAFFLSLMTLGGLLPGGKMVPAEKQGWEVRKEWVEEGDYTVFSAENTVLSEECRRNPSASLNFPGSTHSFQELHADNVLIVQAGDAESDQNRSFFAAPSVSCKQLLNAQKLVWTVYSPSVYFSRFLYFPQIEDRIAAPLSLNELMHLMGSIVVATITCAFLFFFWGRAKTQELIAFTLACLGYAVFAACYVAGILGFNISAFRAEQIGDFGVLTTFIFSARLNYMHGYCSRLTMLVICLVKIIAMIGLVLSKCIDEAQMWVNLALIIYIFFAIEVLLRTSRAFYRSPNISNAISFAAAFMFAIAYINDGLVMSLLLQHQITLSPGVMCSLALLHGVRFEHTIRQAFRERTKLEQRLVEIEKENTIKEASSAIDRAIATTTSLIIHDIKVPFAGLKGILALLRSGNISQETISTITNKLQTTISYVDQLLANLLHPRSEEKPTNKEVIDLDLLVSEIIVSLDQAKFEFQKSLQETKVYASKLGLQRVLTNLIANAIEAQPNGGKIWLRSEKTTLGVSITIGNQGTPIPPERLATIFSGHQSFGKKYGTGLGLTVCRSIVMAHGGDISCQSSAELGAEFATFWPNV